MTTKTDIGQLVAEWAYNKAAADKAYAQKKELEFIIQGYMKDRYPEEWSRLERGITTTFTAEGIKFTRTRQYDTDKLRAAIGEDYPAAITRVEVEKVDGNVVKGLWKDAALAEKLADAVLPAAVSMKVE